VAIDTERLNEDCRCVTLDRGALARALQAAVDEPGFAAELVDSHPHLVSGQPVFLSGRHAAEIAAIVPAIERVASLPGYRAHVLASAPPIAHQDRGPRGVFMGYDFHLAEAGPRLIEINTNAGGALINAYVGEAHRSCCLGMSDLFQSRRSLPDLEAVFVASFRNEWRLQRGSEPGPASIAIVDREPTAQYLYPEFVLFQRLIERHGIRASIAAPRELRYGDGRLWHGDQRIDLVYNRVTDFMLADDDCEALAAAYTSGAAVVTPNPHVHALLANKANLVALSDRDLLTRWGAAADDVALLAAAIPRTFVLEPDHAEALWPERSRYFFKPLAGFGSRGAYRGDKLTRRVWSEITAGGYVAQELVAPSSRAVRVDDTIAQLKLDLRAFTYDGAVQLLAARLYQGQTTNFRTPGGGFAPVFSGDGAVPQCECG
jgi:hypothetical protein